MASTVNTLNALLRRGVDNITASKLIAADFTLQDLQLKTLEELIKLGIPTDQAESILDSSRPPIPDDTFLSVLKDSKWVCCICRDIFRGTIIHHIIEWNESKSHDYDNLALLCLLHHDEAHTKKGLTLMLSPNRLRQLRDQWYEQVHSEDKSIINNTAYIKSEKEETYSQPKYNVDNVEDLIASIRSNTTIRLKKGKYNLSDIAKFRGNKHITWHPVFNGYEPHINGLENLRIIGEAGVEILIDPSYTWVMQFVNCKNISFERVTCGHTSPGSCTGGVLMFYACRDVSIKECDFFGSGTYGITIQNSSDFTIHKTIVRECTYGIAQFFRTKNILLRDCTFIDCKEFDLLTIKDGCENINFLRCKFENNYISWDERYFIDTDATCKEIVIEYSQIYNSNVSKWTNIGSIIITRHNDYMNNKFPLPEDVWWFDS